MEMQLDTSSNLKRKITACASQNDFQFEGRGQIKISLTAIL